MRLTKRFAIAAAILVIIIFPLILLLSLYTPDILINYIKINYLPSELSMDYADVSGNVLKEIRITQLQLTNTETKSDIVKGNELLIQYNILKFLFFGEIIIDRIYLKDCNLNLTQYEDKTWNLVFLNTREKKKKKSKWTLIVKDITVENGKFDLDIKGEKLNFENINSECCLESRDAQVKLFSKNTTTKFFYRPHINLIKIKQSSGTIRIGPNKSVSFENYEARVESGIVRANGTLYIDSSDESDFALSTDGIDMKEIERAFINEKADIFSGRAMTNGIYLSINDKSVVLKGVASSESLKVYDFAFTNPQARLIIDSDSVSLHDFSGNLFGSQVNGRYKFLMKEATHQIIADINDLNLKNILNGTSNIDSNLNTSAKIIIKVRKDGSPDITISSKNINGTLLGLVIENGELLSTFYNNVLELDILSISGKGFNLNSNGNINLDKKSVELNFFNNSLFLSSFSDELQGKVEGFGKIQGNFKNPQVLLEMFSENLSIEIAEVYNVRLKVKGNINPDNPGRSELGFELSASEIVDKNRELGKVNSVNAELELSAGSLQVNKLNFLIRDTVVSGEGKFENIFNKKATIDFSLKGKDVELVAITFLNKRFSKVNGKVDFGFNLKGNGKSITYNVQMNAKNIGLDDIEYGTFSAGLSFLEHVLEIKILQESGANAANGKIFFKDVDTCFDLNVKLVNFNASTLFKITDLRKLEKISSYLNIQASLTGTSSAPVIKVKGIARDFIYEDVLIGDFEIDAEYLKDTLHIKKFDLNNEYSMIRTSGGIPFYLSFQPFELSTSDAKLNFDIECKNSEFMFFKFLLDSYLKIFENGESFESLKNVRGRFNLQVNIKGGLDIPLASGSLEFDNCRFDLISETKETKKVFVFKMKERITSFEFKVRTLTGKILLSNDNLEKNFFSFENLILKLTDSKEKKSGSFALTGTLSLNNLEIEDFEMRINYLNGLIPFKVYNSEFYLGNLDVNIFREENIYNVKGRVVINDSELKSDLLGINSIISSSLTREYKKTHWNNR